MATQHWVRCTSAPCIPLLTTSHHVPYLPAYNACASGWHGSAQQVSAAGLIGGHCVCPAEPVISGQIMELHHAKHHATYVANLNKALEQYAEAEAKQDLQKMISLQGAINFNGGGAWPSTDTQCWQSYHYAATFLQSIAVHGVQALCAGWSLTHRAHEQRRATATSIVRK